MKPAITASTAWVKCFLLVCLLLSFRPLLQSQGCPQGLAGIYKIGPSGTFTSLGNAFNELKQKGIAGPLILELTADYKSNVETFPIKLFRISCADSINNIIIRPEAGVDSLLIISNDSIATIDLNNARFITIDGRSGGNGDPDKLTIQNSNTKGSAIRFVNDASYNQLKFLNIRGTTNSIVNGVVNFSGTDSTTGNDFNRIDTCRVFNGDALPSNLVYSQGTFNKVNTGNVINGCDLFNFYSRKDPSHAICIFDNSDKFVITNNSIYQEATHDYLNQSGTPNWYGIRIFTVLTGGFVVSGNYVGGTARLAGGSRLSCTGQFLFRGITVANGRGIINASIISDNIVTNLYLQCGMPQYHALIELGADSYLDRTFNGTCSGNILGSTSNDSSVTVRADTGCILVALHANALRNDSVTISNNKIGGIYARTNGRESVDIIGIHSWSYGGARLRIAENEIGSPLRKNSIYNYATGDIYGMDISTSGDYDYPSSIAIDGNTINNLTTRANYNKGYDSRITGIYFKSFDVVNTTITKNIIRNFLVNAKESSPNGIVGINVDNSGTIRTSTGNITVSQNQVYSLVSLSMTEVTGIYAWPGNPTAGTFTMDINRNLIHGLETQTNPGTYGVNSVVRGIYVSRENCRTTITNNIVRLGLDVHGRVIPSSIGYYGIYCGRGINKFIHNSVLITGAATELKAHDYSAGFYSGYNDTSTDSLVIQNNIFVNLRSTPKANMISPPNQSCLQMGLVTNKNLAKQDYNLYFAKGDYNSVGGISSITLAEWQTKSGRDQHSLFGDPLFKNPTGGGDTLDLHIDSLSLADGAGNKVYTTQLDFDGEWRNLYTPVDIGADAFNFKMVDTTNTGGNNPGNPQDSTVVTDTTVTAPPGLTYTTYPLPFTSSLTLKVLVDHDTKLKVSLYRLNGNLLITEEFQLLKGENTITITSFKNLPPGTYILSLTTDSNKSSTVIVKG